MIYAQVRSGDLTMTTKRCLILSCTQSKRQSEGLLPAIERYHGPAFRVLRKFLRDDPSALQNVDVFVLSAQHGLISSGHMIADYDQRMTFERARDLQEQVCKIFQSQIAQAGYAEVFLSLGRTYRAALDGCEAVSSCNNLVVSRVSSGKKLTELKAWLYDQQVDRTKTKEPASVTRLQEGEKGVAIIRGIQIEMTTAQVLEAARQALAQGRGNPDNYRAWYVLVDDRRVGPKWLVGQLAGLPVSAFVADEARRVLRQLGIQVHRNV